VIRRVMERPCNHARPDLPYVIRRAEERDAEAIQYLYHELVGEGKTRVLRGQIAILGKSSASFLLVVEAEGTVCATALLSLCADAMHGSQPFGVVENVIVTRHMRGQGLGSRLITHIESLARRHDCTKLMLLSGSHRPEAHAFFRNCGFSGAAKQAFVKYRSQFSDVSR
jgi:N-acetylglutamate synthase-like GNAT family acetyltransferase